MRELDEAGLTPYVSNQIAPRILNVTGNEITSRTRLKFTARIVEQKAQLSAQVLTKLILWLQENNQSSSKWSQAMLKARISGLAFHHILPNNDTIQEEVLNTLEVIWDPEDRTPDFSSSRGMGYVDWMTRDKMRLKWPNKATEIDSAVTDANSPLRARPKGNFGSRMIFGNCGYYNREDDTVMVIVFYYRIPKKFYTYLSKAGRVVNTWSKSEAEKKAAKKDEVSENNGYQVRQCVFSGDILFDGGEYPYQMNYYDGWLPITPIVLAREENTGLPYGLVRAARSDQKLYNKTQARMDWLQRCRQVIMDVGAVDDIAELASEIARPDGIVQKRKGYALELQKNLDEYQAHAQRLPMFIANIERNMGIFDEAIGAQSNASSGKAIQLRKAGSQTTQAMPIDILRGAKRTAGRKMAVMAQMKFTDQLVMSVIGSDGQPQQVWANKPVIGEDGKPQKDPDGNVVREADVTQLDFDVFVEEAPDTATLNQDATQRLSDMIVGGVNVEAMTPGMLKTIGISEDNDLYREVEQGFQQKIQQAQQVMAENEKLKALVAKLQGQPNKIPGGGMPPAMPAGGVTGNNQ